MIANNKENESAHSGALIFCAAIPRRGGCGRVWCVRDAKAAQCYGGGRVRAQTGNGERKKPKAAWKKIGDGEK